MSSLNILSGGAAQGLVKSLAQAFKGKTGLDIGGEFGAVGAMADKLRADELHSGQPTDLGSRITLGHTPIQLAGRDCRSGLLDLRQRLQASVHHP